MLGNALKVLHKPLELEGQRCMAGFRDIVMAGGMLWTRTNVEGVRANWMARPCSGFIEQ